MRFWRWRNPLRWLYRLKNPIFELPSDEELMTEFLAYDDEDEEELIVDQAWIPARKIEIDGFDGAPEDYPWHGHTETDFDQLNQKLQMAAKKIANIKSRADARRFVWWNREVYSAYFLSPIQVFVEDGIYKMHMDGRHRIYAAQKADCAVPVWVIKYYRIKSVTFEEYKKRVAFYGWRFLG